MNPFYVYILKCNDNSYYVGHTDDIEKRMSEHKEAIHWGYVSKRLPVELVFVEQFGSRIEALEAERKLKGWSREKKETLIKGGWEAMKGFWKRSRKK